MAEPPIDFDGAWKHALETYFEAFIAFFLPEVHADIDWTQEFIFGKDITQTVA
ncbi:MAG: hypothetical protein IPK16_31020 [Anaerolineales bacterium]|nr:hypothetical protein [Anaerolineales bacterium]